jgi:hypothetical protein
MATALRLPPELWLIIFRLATDAPEAYDTSILPPLTSYPRSWDDHDALSGPEIDVHNFAVHTKYCIALVSRQWNGLALGLLYEHVLVRSSEGLSSLVLALNNRRNIGNGSSEGVPKDPTWHTQRLELNIYSAMHFDYYTLGRTTYFGDVATLLSFCPNLKVFNLSTEHDWKTYWRTSATSLIPILQKVGSTLRHLRWDSDDPIETLPKWLSCLPLLEVLEIHADSHRDSGRGGPAASLPCLHTLIIYGMGQLGVTDVVARWDLPCLKRLILRVKFELDEDPDEYRLLTAFGVRITDLDITDCLTQGIRPLISRCPNLTELSISADTFIYDVLPLLERVSVTLEVYDGQAASTTVKVLDSCMVKLYSTQLPKLKAVRLADLDHKRIKKHVKLKPTLREKVKEWIGKWSERGVRFEDPSGRLLSERPVFQEANE